MNTMVLVRVVYSQGMVRRFAVQSEMSVLDFARAVGQHGKVRSVSGLIEVGAQYDEPGLTRLEPKSR